MMKYRWSIRAFREGDEQGIYDLFQTVYPSEQPSRDEWMSWFERMYRDGPAGTGYTWIAEHNGKIVAHYSVVPVAVKIGDDILICGQSIDTMTHPDYRRQGVFETLAKQVYQDLHKGNIHIVYGFPGFLSYPGFIQKLNWFDVSTFQTVIKPINWNNTIREKIQNKYIRGILAIGAKIVLDKLLFRTQYRVSMTKVRISQIGSFDERFDRLWERVSNQRPIMIVRNKKYLNWRYSASGKHYLIYAAEKGDEIHGYLVMRNIMKENKTTGFIFDLIAENEDIGRSLISKAVEGSCQSGVDCIIAKSIFQSDYYQYLRNSGFIPLLRNKQHFIVYSNMANISKSFLQNSRNWFISMGDSDVL